MEGFEVGIVGAGVHGASAAFHLASRGVRVLVVERWGPAEGPTGRSSAVCRANYSNPFLAEVARDSLAMFQSFGEATAGRDAGYRETGALFLHPASDDGHVREAVDRLNAIGTPAEVLAAEDLAGRFPSLDLEGVGVAVWEAHAGYADPVGTTMGLFERALELGATARLRTEVVGLEPQPHGGAVLVTSDGARTPCERVLVAAGPWNGRVVGMLGAELPLTVERHIVAVAAMSEEDRLPFVMADVTSNYYCKPEGPDLLAFGHLEAQPEADPDRFDEDVRDEEAAALVEPAARRIRKLDEAELRRGWASLYDVSPDWMPVIGDVADGVFVDGGTSGHGFKLAPALGRHVADLVTGAPTDPRLDDFHPRRLAVGASIDAGYGEARILG
jgi:sarcosine oxidase subunit beta